MCHSKNNSLSFTFKLCVNKATRVITRKLFYMCSTFKVKVNHMLGVNIKFIEYDDNKE